MLKRTSYIVGSILIVCIALLVAGWTLKWMIPTHADYCETNQYTGDKECATYHIALIALWQIGKFFDYISAPLTAFATVAIGWFTYTLRNSTNQLWEAGERQFQLEGPFLHPTVTYTGDIFKRRSVSAPGPFPLYAVVNYKLHNAGRSPAFPTSIADRLGHLTGVPPIPKGDIGARYEVDHVIDANDTGNRTYTCCTEIPISEDDLSSITNGKSFIFLYGAIDFSDLIDNQYTQRFCLVYRPKERIFIRHGSPGYNKRTKKSERETGS